MAGVPKGSMGRDETPSEGHTALSIAARRSLQPLLARRQRSAGLWSGLPRDGQSRTPGPVRGRPEGTPSAEGWQ